MREHIEDQPAAGRALVVPAHALRRVEIAVEHPPAEIELDRQNAAEIIRLVQFAQLLEPGQEQFVLHRAVLDSGVFGRAASDSACSRVSAAGFSV
jgi:hypothetical protein